MGGIRITYLPDGVANFSYDVFPGSSLECWARHASQTSDGRWVCSIGGFLIESGDQKILVDLGFGNTELEVEGFVSAKSGNLLTSLGAAGATPAGIDTVVYTHMHADHTGWTVTDNALTFGNARHLAGPGEVEHWLAHADESFAPAQQLPFTSQFEVSTDGETLAPGVEIIHASGHTPGHQCVVVSSGTERAVILGDTIHTSAQLEEPDLTFMFDVDPVAARQWREDILTKLQDTGTTVGACHFSGSAFGRVMTGQGRRFWASLGG
ncbi:MBL fold metallo-hydrolase [Nonomuraea aurantiaca]|uniref:MBL fold metallo-hydrolase n=1 Tax=Nonomuraea aurantiaca TaxID=2878562 RepID=UPI001CD98B8D|nr:MBL fold metallo-hydrolase [Nonomuraea aurantiaca]MCA2230276.1 MBL fold metallo-hydrolase [Nonomuraea aurantiaca]